MTTPSIPANKYTDSSLIFHVDYLKATFNDFARTNLYKVEFIFDKATVVPEFLKLELLAKSVNMPDFNIGTKEIKRMGQRLYLPATQNYGDIQMVFVCDDNYTQKKMLHNWLFQLVYNTDENTFPTSSNFGKFVTRILQLDNKFNIIFGIEFVFCWPTSLGELQLSQESDAQISEFPVTFKFSTYKVMDIT